jgi:hypothetical protein
MNKTNVVNKKFILIAAIVIIVGAGAYFVLNPQKSPPLPPITNLPPGPITVSGEITCLPKVGPGPHTMECAMGLKGTDGRHYGLRNLFKIDPEHKFSRDGLKIEVSGMLLQEEMKGPDGNKYDIVGIIDVISIKELGN